MLPDARQAWLSAQESGWGDPARLHRPGRLAAGALDRAREVVAAAVGARPDEVTFTASGGPPSFAAVAGLARGRRRAGARIVTTAVDHSSVLKAAADAGEHVAVEVDDQGRLDVAAWQAAVRRSGTALAALQVGNHEVGTMQPFAAAIASAHAAGVPDVPAIHAAGVALNWWLRSGRVVGERQRRLVDRLRSEIAETVPDVYIAGDPVRRLPQLLTFSVPSVDAEALTRELDEEGFAVASGSASRASFQHPSHVLTAMGAPIEGNVRIGLTRTTTEDEIEAFLAALPPIVARLRDETGVA